MNFVRSPLVVHISDVDRQIFEHERLMLVLKDKTASFSFKTLDIGVLFFRKRKYFGTVAEEQVSASFDEKRRYFIHCFTEYLRQMQGSELSKALFYYTIKNFINWIDDQKRVYDFTRKNHVS